jgi:hypothetical protein
MKIKKYVEFFESIILDLNLVDELIDINESLSIWHDVVLRSIGATELDIYGVFKLPPTDYQDTMHIDYLSNNVEFLNSLSSIGLKKSKVESTEDYNTFLTTPCEFMFIYRVEANELENPEYVLFQVWDGDKWDACKLYKINNNINNFYNKLSSKVLELDLDGKKYVYNTSNGTEWILQNIEQQNDNFKKYLRLAELEELLHNKKIKLTII